MVLMVIRDTGSTCASSECDMLLFGFPNILFCSENRTFVRLIVRKHGPDTCVCRGRATIRLDYHFLRFLPPVVFFFFLVLQAIRPPFTLVPVVKPFYVSGAGR